MHKFYGGRGRTRTGTPVSQKQILSPETWVCPSPCLDTASAFDPQKINVGKGNRLTLTDIC
jgi:hypothetical protein